MIKGLKILQVLPCIGSAMDTKIDNRGGRHIFMYLWSALIVSFEIDCFEELLLYVAATYLYVTLAFEVIVLIQVRGPPSISKHREQLKLRNV